MRLLKTIILPASSNAALIMLLMFSTHAYSEPAGKILAAMGENQILSINGDVERTLNRGSAIYSGDVINTKNNSNVQIRFQDGTLISLKQNTRFSIDNYKRDKKTKVLKRSLFSLIKGKFRSITNLVSQGDKRAYRVRTGVATIGVRGTDYEASFCTSNCAGSTQGKLLLNVFEGEIVIHNDAGEFLMQHGDIGNVPDAHSPVQLTPELAPVVKNQNEQLVNSSNDSGNTDDPDETTTAENTDDTVASADDAIFIDEIILLPESTDVPIEFISGDALQCIKF